jgi:hexulose-6-phosphate isomerase
MKMGVMQGRLSPRPYPRLQAFPWNTWEKEFEDAGKLGLHSIEWVFEKDGFDLNPIWTAQGRGRIKKLIAQGGVKVASVCADYFLDADIYRYSGGERKRVIGVMTELIKKALDVGVHTILFPVLEEAELKSGEDRKRLSDFLFRCGDALGSCSVRIGIEAELPADEYLGLIREINSERVRVYYDVGNCAAKGYDAKRDLETLCDVLIGIHIKDRKRNGPSVFLGQGDANIAGGLGTLLKKTWGGVFIFQAYFEDEPFVAIKNNIAYINNMRPVYRKAPVSQFRRRGRADPHCAGESRRGLCRISKPLPPLRQKNERVVGGKQNRGACRGRRRDRGISSGMARVRGLQDDVRLAARTRRRSDTEPDSRV